MELTDLSGKWHGSRRYDKLKIQITSAGGFNVGKFRVYSSDSKQLFGSQGAENHLGGMQEINNGLYVRFAGGSCNLDDTWYVEVRNDEPTNASAGSIELWR